MASGLSVKNLTKRFGEAAAVENVSFEVASGEFFTMLGPSGCGKTTTLRMIAGLETATAGGIILDGQDYTAVPARQRNIGMVFQSYALFPHLSVFENVAYGLRVRRTASEDVARRVEETLGLLGLSSLARRLPSELSGGQQQRVSLARALVYRPQLLLLDEPLANLDAKLRVQMREEIRRVQRALGIMVLYVTHDQEEAMAVSDRIAVFNHGRLMQVDAPAATYAQPNSLFAADFIGQANFIPAGEEAGLARLAVGGTLRAARRVVAPFDDLGPALGSAPAYVMVRPEHVTPGPSDAAFSGRVARIQPLGAVTRYAITVDGLPAPLVMDRSRAIEGFVEGGDCVVGFQASDATLFVANGA